MTIVTTDNDELKTQLEDLKTKLLVMGWKVEQLEDFTKNRSVEMDNRMDRKIELLEDKIDAEKVRQKKKEAAIDSVPTNTKDTYLFIAKGPRGNIVPFTIGILVFIFQLSTLLLIAAGTTWATTDDNPKSSDVGYILARFIPTDASILVKASQILMIFAFSVFSNASIQDIIQSVHLIRQPGGSMWSKISCLLRFSQGTVACITTFLLIMSSTDPIDIVLNVTAITYVSDWDSFVFRMARWGWLGPNIKALTDDIADNEENSGFSTSRMSYTIATSFILLMGVIFFVVIQVKQSDQTLWKTEEFTVRFQGEDNPLREYSGRYYKSDIRNDRRFVYKSVDSANAGFTYCHVLRQWLLVKYVSQSPCTLEETFLARSPETDSFDISSEFDATWVDPFDAPILASFNNEGGNAGCFSIRNNFENNYDNGDCCASTCVDTVDRQCGDDYVQMFGVLGFGFPNCKDHRMGAVTITLTDVTLSGKVDEILITNGEPETITSNLTSTHPLAKLIEWIFILELTCDGKKVFSVPVNPEMKGRHYKAMVEKGAKCKMTKYISQPRYYFNFPSDENGIYFETSNNESNINGTHVDFVCLQGCKISPQFTIEYDVKMDTGRKVVFDEKNEEIFPNTVGALYNLDSRWSVRSIRFIDEGMSGTIPNDIGSLVNLTILNLGGKNSFTGTIPESIGDLTNLEEFWLDASDNVRGVNSFTGTIPESIGNLRYLQFLGFGNNLFTGTIPESIGNLRNLQVLTLGHNAFTGSIPESIYNLDLYYFEKRSFQAKNPKYDYDYERNDFDDDGDIVFTLPPLPPFGTPDDDRFENFHWSTPIEDLEDHHSGESSIMFFNRSASSDTTTSSGFWTKQFHSVVMVSSYSFLFAFLIFQ